jgi:NTE family protein
MLIRIEPNHRDPELYLANTFSYSQRRHLAEHAYQQTRQMLRSNQTNLAAKFAYHGITLNHRRLDDTQAHLCAPKHPPSRVGQALTKLHNLMNNLSQVVDGPRTESQAPW